MSGIPFTLPDIGLREIKGKIFMDEAYLILDVEDAFMGEFDKDHQVIKIEPGALKEIRLERGLFRDHLCLRPKNEELLRTIPGSFGVEVPLRIWKTHRRRTEELIDELARRRGLQAVQR